MLAEPSKALKRAAGRRAPIYEKCDGTSVAALCHAHQDSDRRYDKNSRGGGDHGHNLLLPVGVSANFSPLN
jgi:hypothetical protein